MRNVPHLVTLAQAHGRAEVVLDDAEVVAVVGDVGRQLCPVAPSDDALLAQSRRLPVHFQLQLVGFDEPRRLGQSFAELPEEKQKSVGLRLVVPEGGVAGGQAAAIDRAPHQRQPRVAVPRLGGRGRRNDETDGERGTHDGERQVTHRGVI